MTGSDDTKPKPSDFYPGNVKRVPRNATRLDMNTQQSPSQEPTSPLSPPPGDVPIPMGFSTDHQPASAAAAAGQAQEPMSPQPIPSDVPIPMPYCPIKEQSANGQKPDEVDNNAAKEPEVEERAAREKSSEPAPKTSKVPDPAMDKLGKVREAVKELSSRIEAFKGDKKDKEYLFLDEMLTRHLVSLDCIEANGRDDIRQTRRETIKSINRCLSQLDHNTCQAGGGDAADNNAVIDQLAAQSEAEKTQQQQK